jgi:Fe2+ or Zn2+ uptake regulation protein
MSDIHNPPTTRITSQRQAIFQLVDKSGSHISAEQIYADVKKSLPRISLGTVYRNLEGLVASGLIAKVMIGGVGRYERETRFHYHAVCLACRAIDNLDTNPAADIEEYFGRQTSYKLTSHDLILYGLCANCQRQR